MFEVFTAIVSGATIFGAIIATVAWFNGRMIKNVINVIKEEAKNTRALIEKLSELIVAEGNRTREVVQKGFDGLKTGEQKN